ncbi:RHS repeat-associated core domain-containing protein, partial [bacterium]|nr:RHS repeat-associated core domain-containing protein [bacterium]
VAAGALRLCGGAVGRDTGLVYLRARWYDPASGTFLIRDPSRQEQHLYQYARSNPINAIDPSGLLCSTWIVGDPNCQPIWTIDDLQPGESYLERSMRDSEDDLTWIERYAVGTVEVMGASGRVLGSVADIRDPCYPACGGSISLQ